MTEYNKIGDKIKQIRTEKRLTQEQLAQKVGAEQCSISNIERAKKGSGVDNLNKLAEIGTCLEIEVQLDIDGEKFSLTQTSKYKSDEKENKMNFFYKLSNFAENVNNYWKQQDVDVNNFEILAFASDCDLFDDELELYGYSEGPEENSTHEPMLKIKPKNPDSPIVKISFLQHNELPHQKTFIYPKQIIIQLDNFEDEFVFINLCGKQEILYNFSLNYIIDICNKIHKKLFDIVEEHKRQMSPVHTIKDILIDIEELSPSTPFKIKIEYSFYNEDCFKGQNKVLLDDFLEMLKKKETTIEI